MSDIDKILTWKNDKLRLTLAKAIFGPIQQYADQQKITYSEALTHYQDEFQEYKVDTFYADTSKVILLSYPHRMVYLQRSSESNILETYKSVSSLEIVVVSVPNQKIDLSDVVREIEPKCHKLNSQYLFKSPKEVSDTHFFLKYSDRKFDTLINKDKSYITTELLRYDSINHKSPLSLEVEGYFAYQKGDFTELPNKISIGKSNKLEFFKFYQDFIGIENNKEYSAHSSINITTVPASALLAAK